MSESPMPDWLAKEMRKGAEASIKSGFDAFYKTKDRALSILGWSVTIEIASVGVLVGTDHKFIWPVGAVVFGNAVVSVLCIYILMSAYMFPPTLTGADIEDLYSKRGVSNQSELDISISDALDTHYAINRRKHKKRQQALCTAWVVFVLTPIIGLLFLPSIGFTQRIQNMLG